MMKQLVLPGMLVLIALTVRVCNQPAGPAAVSAPAVESAQLETKAVISITVPPSDDDAVGRQMTVEGKGAFVPSGTHLWAAVRRADFAGMFWPQNEAMLDRATGHWSVHMVFGESRDIGHQFEILVIAVDEQGHARLKEYRDKAMQTGVWLPIDMPSAVSGLQGIRRVKKVSHY